MKAKKKNDPILTNPRVHRSVMYVLLSVWGIILVFGLLTLIRVGFLKEISKPGRTEEARGYIEEGNKLMFRGEQTRDRNLFLMACEKFRNALKIDSLSTDALGNLATACLYAGNTEEARNIYYKLLKIDSINAYLTYTYLGDLEEKEGNIQKALDYYLLAVKGHLDPAYPLRKAGLLSIRSGKYTEARKYLEMALNEEKCMEKVYSKVLLKNYYSAKKDADSTGARELLNQLSSADYQKELGRFDTASLRQLIDHNKGIAYSYLYLGDLYVINGFPDSANSAYSNCIRYFPALQNEINNRKQPAQKLSGK